MIDFGRNEWRTARKPHKCYLCGKEIQKGERYYYADGMADGEFFDWLIEESRKADDKAHHVGGQFNLGYAARVDACCEKFVKYVDGRYKV